MSARERILDFLQNEAKRPMSAEELCSYFDISPEEQNKFIDILEELQHKGLVFKNKAGKYGIPEKFKLVTGRIDRNPRGFSFLIPEDPEREDIFISLENMNGAMHNDKVFARILPQSRGKKQEGEVVKVIERANSTIVGNLDIGKSQYFGFVVPDNKRIYSDVFIPREELKGAKRGQKVVAKITRWPRQNRNPEGKVIEILGFKDESGVDIEAIIRQLGLPGDFPGEVMKETQDISLDISEAEKRERRDLRDLPMVTIDGEDAKDFDDAVSIEKVDDNVVRLGVHIADVSHYVKEGQPLDDEAVNRGTSIYLVDRVIPMLPEKLSNGICSLKPGEERLTLSVFMEYELEPLNLVDYEITESIIKSNYRLTYNEVRKILNNNDPELTGKYNDFVRELELMNRLRKKMRKERFGRGSINFDFPEVNVKLDDSGKPIKLMRRKHGVSEQLIEEFMIAANRVVAEDMYWREIPFIFRVHDQPDSDRIYEFNEFIHNFGYHLKGVSNGIHPRALQDLLEKVKGKDVERIINSVLLRTMKKAIYTEKNIGHFGLALDYYTHFTSPIRRYPDLMIHRIIKEVLHKGKLSGQRREELENKIPEIADHSSLQERRAMEAERDSVDLKKIQYMEDKIGIVYDGIISGITSFGFFVELSNSVEGLVHVESLTDDYYHLYQDQYALIGERTGNIYRLGNKVRVKVVKVNTEERELDLKIAEE